MRHLKRLSSGVARGVARPCEKDEGGAGEPGGGESVSEEQVRAGAGRRAVESGGNGDLVVCTSLVPLRCLSHACSSLLLVLLAVHVRDLPRGSALTQASGLASRSRRSRPRRLNAMLAILCARREMLCARREM
jgi:hypothetical protein